MVDFIQPPDPNSWPAEYGIPELPNVGYGMQFNQILDIISDPCDAPWHLMITTALPLIGSAILVLLTPDVGEVLESYVEPKGYGSCRKNRRNERGRKAGTVLPNTGRPFRLGIPDVDELIAGLLPGRDFFEGRRIGATEAIAWKIFNVTELVGYRLLLLDLVGSSIYAWHSAMLATEWCQATALQVAKCEDTNWLQSVNSAPQVVPQLGPKTARNGADAGINGILMTRFNWRLISYWKLSNPGATRAQGTFRLMGSQNGLLRSFFVDLAPGEEREGYFRQTIQGPDQIFMTIKTDSGNIGLSETMLWGQQLSDLDKA